MEKLSVKKRYSRLTVPMKIKPQAAIPACRALLIKRGCRVVIAKMPPTNAYAAQTNARSSANEPNTSTELPPISLAAQALLSVRLNPRRHRANQPRFPPLFADPNLSRLACPLPPFPDSPKRLHISRRTLPARAPQQTAHPGLAALPRAPVNYP